MTPSDTSHEFDGSRMLGQQICISLPLPHYAMNGFDKQEANQRSEEPCWKSSSGSPNDCQTFSLADLDRQIRIKNFWEYWSFSSHSILGDERTTSSNICRLNPTLDSFLSDK
eukprot:scaffold2271_cov130-Cylindrotheca_fusiformis.AAC.2